MNTQRLRNEMVERQIAARGVRDARVLAAMRKVPREHFMPPELDEFAYEDSPQPLPRGQTISQPYIVALMIEALRLKGGETVLEIGAGFGYAAAVLGQIAREVYTIETIEPLARAAQANLARQGYDNVHVRHGDGTLGWLEHAPYDAIVVAAGGPSVPEALEAAIEDRRPAGDPGRRRSARAGTAACHARRCGCVRHRRSRRRALRSADRRAGLGRRRAAAGRTAQAGRRSGDPSATRWPRRSAPVAKPFTDIDSFAPDALLRPHRRRARRADRRGVARHVRVLPDARAHHAGADRAEELQSRRDRGRLAGCRAHRPLRAPHGVSAVRVARLRALSDLDVAQRRDRRGSSTGCIPTTPTSRSRGDVAFYGLDLYSMYTSVQVGAGRISTRSTRRPARLRARATAA